MKQHPNDWKRYRPILRWRQSEQLALREMWLFKGAADLDLINPIFEIVPCVFFAKEGTQKSISDVITKCVDGIFDNWGYVPCHVDLCHLPPNWRTETGKHPLTSLFDLGRLYQLTLIPVTGMRRPGDYQEAVRLTVKEDNRGLCLRLHSCDIETPYFEKQIQHLLHFFGLSPEQVDLLVDYQEVDDSSPVFVTLAGRIPDLERWRSFTFAGGSFPKDLSGFSLGEYEIPRKEWQTYQNLISSRSAICRIPAFGDYTIQSPYYFDYSPDDRPLNTSASIRYAAKDYWVIMRGEGLFHKGSLGHIQYIGLAQLLSERNEFGGPDFSSGDRYIDEISKQNKKKGNIPMWLRVGINHHITLTNTQIIELCDSLGNGKH